MKTFFDGLPERVTVLDAAASRRLRWTTIALEVGTGFVLALLLTWQACQWIGAL